MTPRKEPFSRVTADIEKGKANMNLKVMNLKASLSIGASMAVGVLSAFECSESAKAKARDFIDNEKQFHLGFIPT